MTVSRSVIASIDNFPFFSSFLFFFIFMFDPHRSDPSRSNPYQNDIIISEYNMPVKIPLFTFIVRNYFHFFFFPLDSILNSGINETRKNVPQKELFIRSTYNVYKMYTFSWSSVPGQEMLYLDHELNCWWLWLNMALVLLHFIISIKDGIFFILAMSLKWLYYVWRGQL